MVFEAGRERRRLRAPPSCCVGQALLRAANLSLVRLARLARPATFSTLDWPFFLFFFFLRSITASCSCFLAVCFVSSSSRARPHQDASGASPASRHEADEPRQLAQLPAERVSFVCCCLSRQGGVKQRASKHWSERTGNSKKLPCGLDLGALYTSEASRRCPHRAQSAADVNVLFFFFLFFFYVFSTKAKCRVMSDSLHNSAPDSAR